MLIVIFCVIGLQNSFAETISIQSNKEYYQAGEVVKIFGSVQNGEDGNLVGFQIKDPKGETIVIRTIALDSEGEFEIEFKIPKDGDDGKYTVSANAKIDGDKISGTKYLMQGFPDDSKGENGGCLIATAAYGSEMTSQVQILREIRDNQLMNTKSGASFMTGFNEFYYSFSPYVADLQRENPTFKEAVKIGITPLLSTLSIMSSAESESEVIRYGVVVILMNFGMYLVAPAILLYGIKKKF